MEERLKRLFLLLVLLTLTACAAHRPLPRIIHRPLGTTFVEYTDGSVVRFQDQYKSYVEGASLRLEHSSGFVRGVSVLLWTQWWWVPNTNIPKVQSVADN